MMTDYLKSLQALKLGTKAKVIPERNKIPIKSVKRLVEEKLYKKIVVEMIKDDPECKIKAPGCRGRADGLHHIVKRSPKNYTDRNNLIQSCNLCQNWIEKNPLEAIKKGFSKSKYLN